MTSPKPKACGTRSGYVAGCGCEPCRAANRTYQRERSRQLRRPDGAWTPFVETGLPRLRIEELAEAGMGVRTIADRAGVACSTVSRIRSGAVGHVSAAIAAAILAVEFAPAAAARVPADQARQARNALQASGWRPSQIASASGVPVTALRLRGRQCHADTRSRLVALAALAGAKFRAGALVEPPLPAEVFDQATRGRR